MVLTDPMNQADVARVAGKVGQRATLALESRLALTGRIAYTATDGSIRYIDGNNVTVRIVHDSSPGANGYRIVTAFPSYVGKIPDDK